MKKVATITKEQFEKIISDKKYLKDFVKYPKNKKINSGWSKRSLKSLNNLKENTVYFVKPVFVDGSIVVPPTALFVSLNPEGYKIAYESDIGVDFISL